MLQFEIINQPQSANWGEALLWFLATIIILKIAERYIVSTLRRWATKTKTEADDIIIGILNSIGWPMYITLGIYLGGQSLPLTSQADKILTTITLIVTFFYLVQGLQKLADYLISISLSKSKHKGFDDPMIKKVFGWIARGVIYGTALILILQNLGFQISALLGGLGIGGIAIAFALQNVLSDIFAFFSIYFDKPFEIGDFVIVGNDMGTVERIGLKTTKLRALEGQELVISNQEMTTARVNNYGRFEKRRVVFSFGVTYDTTSAKLKKIPEIVKKIIKDQDHAEVDRVHFKNFGDFALNFEVVYYVHSPDYGVYMDTQHAINIGIKETFEKKKIDMAFPTQTIHLQK